VSPRFQSIDCLSFVINFWVKVVGFIPLFSPLRNTIPESLSVKTVRDVPQMDAPTGRRKNPPAKETGIWKICIDGAVVADFNDARMHDGWRRDCHFELIVFPRERNCQVFGYHLPCLFVTRWPGQMTRLHGPPLSLPPIAAVQTVERV
jgi:hypothetical protein